MNDDPEKKTITECAGCGTEIAPWEPAWVIGDGSDGYYHANCGERGDSCWNQALRRHLAGSIERLLADGNRKDAAVLALNYNMGDWGEHKPAWLDDLLREQAEAARDWYDKAAREIDRYNAEREAAERAH